MLYVDVTCYFHTPDTVGEQFIIRLWISMFSHSPKVRLSWNDQTGRAMASYSARPLGGGANEK